MPHVRGCSADAELAPLRRGVIRALGVEVTWLLVTAFGPELSLTADGSWQRVLATSLGYGLLTAGAVLVALRWLLRPLRDAPIRAALRQHRLPWPLAYGVAVCAGAAVGGQAAAHPAAACAMGLITAVAFLLGAAALSLGSAGTRSRVGTACPRDPCGDRSSMA